MLVTLTQIAKQLLEYEGKEKGLSRDLIALNHLCEDPRKMQWIKKRRVKETVRVLSLELEGKKPMFKLEDYKHDERWKYLHALPTGRHGIGTSWVADLRVADKKEKIKIVRRAIKEIKNGLRSLENRLGAKKIKVDWLTNCQKNLLTNESKLISRVANDINEKVLITLQYEGKKGGEIPEIQNAFVEQRLVGEQRAKGVGKHVCEICNKRGDVRSSLPSKFRFSGYADKPVFSPNKQPLQSWKYVPICIECTKWLFIGADFLENVLRERIAGKFAYLLPNLEPGILKMPTPFVQYLYKGFKRSIEGRILPEYEDIPTRETEQNPFGYLLEEYDWEGPPPFRSLSLIFHQPGQKFRFLYTTSEIMPNQLKRLSENLKGLRNECRVIGGPWNRLAEKLKGDLQFLNDAWRWPGEQRLGYGPLKLNPMRLAEAILTQNPPDFDIFMSDIDRILKRVYSEAITRKETTLRQAISERVMLIWALYVLLYITKVKSENKMLQTQNVPAETWRQLFADMKVLDTDTKRAVFLIGVLFGRVEYAQRHERKDWAGEMPILSSIRSLTLSFNEIKERLFPNLLIKVRQLSAYSLSISELETAIGYYLARGENIDDEVARFVFSLGWASNQHINDFIRNAIKKKEVSK